MNITSLILPCIFGLLLGLLLQPFPAPSPVLDFLDLSL
jgi:hypothetical protein